MPHELYTGAGADPAERFRREVEAAFRRAGIPRRGRPPKQRWPPDEAERQGELI